MGTIDLAANDEADANVIVSKDANWSAQAEVVMSGKLLILFFIFLFFTYFFLFNHDMSYKIRISVDVFFFSSFKQI